MDTLIKLNNQTVGRDKLARLFQYSCRLLWYRLQQHNKGSVHGFQNLEYQLSTFRKLLRFGRCIDILHSAIALSRHPNPILRYTITLSKINNALFLLADHILWLGRADLYNVDTDKWSQISNKYWLYSITMNLVRDFYEILLILKAERGRFIPKDGCRTFNDVLKISGKALLLLHENPNVMVDTIKNCCDFFIPLSALGHFKLSPGTIGLLGMISSVAGLIAIVDPALKVTPA